ncbi:MAG: Rpn family recombination-promoting nuclease/putative transposase [Lachnospiraceae bacterium]|nr:Rpn family recombination-promoting nuclease/putative transposase [Lachnospiraceae bacterium]
MKKTEDDFIMLPTVDFCFKELMQNEKVRKGFISALLNCSPDDITQTVLMPTILGRDTPEDKEGILDVRVALEDGTQLDMEMQVAYFAYWEKRILFYLGKMYTGQLKKGEPYEALKKCIHVSILDFVHFPEDSECYRVIHFRDEKSGKMYTDLMEIQILELRKLLPVEVGRSGVIDWMQFFNGKSRKEFCDMAKKNEYLDEACNTLMELSADEKKRLEYEARERALRDYNSQMNSARKLGMEQGRQEGLQEGRQEGVDLAKTVFKLFLQGKSPDEIAEISRISEDEVRKILE